VIFSVETIYSILDQKNDSIARIETVLQSQSEEKAQVLYSKIEAVSRNASVLAQVISYDENISEADYGTLIRTKLTESPLLFGMGYWLLPNYLSKELLYYGPYYFKDSNGKMTKTMIYSQESYNYFLQDWYNEGMQSNEEIHYSMPYYDSTMNTTFLTASAQIKKDDDSIGLVTADITLREIREYIKQVEVNENINMFLITRDGYFWGRSDRAETDLNENINTTDNKELKSISHLVLYSADTKVSNQTDNIYVWAPIGNTGLKLMLTYSKHEVIGDVYRKSIQSSLFFLVAMMLFILLLNYTLSQWFEKPLLRILNENVSIIEDNLLESKVSGLKTDKKRKKEQRTSPNFENMVFLIHCLLQERNESIQELNKTNSELNIKNEEVEALYQQTTAMNNKLYDLLDEIKAGYIVTVRSLSNAIEAKDKYTKGHCENVTQYALAIGKAFHVSDEDMTYLEYAALLHDVGKIGIPSSILNKPSALNDDEYAMIKKHPEIGYEILKDIDFLGKSVRIIKHHHERIDGKGYPDGLKGDQIDLLTKIINVADAYDAMTSARPYRTNPLTTEKALSILKENKGEQFDEAVVDCFVGLIEGHNQLFVNKSYGN